MEKLDAVNYLLGLMGSTPVGDLETLHPDVVACITKLDDATKTIQSRRWWFNTDYDVELTPDETTKELLLPTDTYKMISTSRQGAVQRGTKVYDTYCNTYQFDAPIYVNLIRHLDWTLLDYAVQDAIKFLAGKQLMSDDLEDEIKADAQNELLIALMIQLKKENLMVLRRNMLLTPQILKARYRVRPYRLGAQGRNPLFPGG